MTAAATKPDAVPGERNAPMLPKLPSGCTGDCEDGGRDCTCGRSIVGMWDDEMRTPRRAALLYLGVLLGSMLLSHCAKTGGAP